MAVSDETARNLVHAARDARKRGLTALQFIAEHVGEATDDTLWTAFDVSGYPVREAIKRLTCTHENTRDNMRNLYDQRPRSEGRALKARGRICDNCGAVFPRDRQS